MWFIICICEMDIYAKHDLDITYDMCLGQLRKLLNYNMHLWWNIPDHELQFSIYNNLSQQLIPEFNACTIRKLKDNGLLTDEIIISLSSDTIQLIKMYKEHELIRVQSYHVQHNDDINLSIIVNDINTGVIYQNYVHVLISLSQPMIVKDIVDFILHDIYIISGNILYAETVHILDNKININPTTPTTQIATAFNLYENLRIIISVNKLGG